ncbi:adenine/guanine/hypoxanthine permease [Entomortierella parvispora]|uniref:Adenine/guanine/hypoxanthine permease n=1 Tax=Entomortierella parvispora TaxID=205924 RepID=A0A9P3H5L5_9FUNG|nr:adenine/guanine/hypoxanthine permease [Entomortierella parvispora]
MPGFVEKLNTAVARSPIGRWFMLEGSSHPKARPNTRFSTEIRAGFATFVTMAYIISVNSLIISDTGGTCVCDYDPSDPLKGGSSNGTGPGAGGAARIAYCSANADYMGCVDIIRKDLIVATAAMACIASTAIGLFSNLPLGMAPGMGINAYFTYTVVGKFGSGRISYQVALAAVFIEGLIFLVLSVLGLRQWLARCIPRNIKVATGVGIGLYLCFIGMQSSAGIGLIGADPATLVGLGGCNTEYLDATGACVSHRMESPRTWMGVLGLFMISILVLFKVKGAILIGILFVAVVSWFRHSAVTYFPFDPQGESRFQYFKQVVSFHTIQKTWAVMDFELNTGEFWLALITFLYVDILDTTGTMFSMAQFAGFMDPKTGDFEGSTPAFITDALCVTLGAVFGTSDVTAFVESGAGITEGGRTGLTAIMTGFCFFISLFFSPIFSAIPPWATGPALIFVGSLMTKSVTEINFNYIGDSIPAFLTLAMMPLTYNIAYGLLGGLLAAVVINGTVWLVEKLSGGRWVPPNKNDRDPVMSFRMGPQGEGVLPPWLVRLIRKIKGQDPLEHAEHGVGAGASEETLPAPDAAASTPKAVEDAGEFELTEKIPANQSATASGVESSRTRRQSHHRNSIGSRDDL